jgi:probable rRNA maturation factor
MSSDRFLIFETRAAGCPRRELEAFAAQLSVELAGARPFCALVTTEARLHELNREFRHVDASTDVLSFPSGDSAGPLGDIAISVAHARRQALEFGHATATEIRVLLLHGLLHLLGHDHETDRGRMRRLETRLRQRYGLPAGLIERTSRDRKGADTRRPPRSKA